MRGWGLVARRGVWAAVVGLAVAGPLLARAAWEGRAELQRADEAAAAGRVDLEVTHLGRAARWRVPLASHDETALARLMALGAEAEADVAGRGPQTALLAYREARSALLATRAFGVADPATYAAANQRIAALMAEQERLFETDLSGVGAAEEHHMQLLERSGERPIAWAPLLAAGAVLAGAAALGLGFPVGRSPRRGPLVVLAALALLLGSLAWLRT